MSERYPGGFITKNTPVTTQTSASGVWTLDQAMQATKAGNWPVNGPFYIEDVFSTWLYTGTGASQAIANGIDLSTKGGLVWLKSRSQGTQHILEDSARGISGSNIVADSSTSAQPGNDTNGAGNVITSLNTTGFTLGTGSGYAASNVSSQTYVSWTFREQPKFFDVVTYTGTGANRTVAHNLGSVPGCIIVKAIDASGYNWTVYHVSTGNTGRLNLNDTSAFTTTASAWNNTTPTSTVFSVGVSGDVNNNGTTYVAYLFAHDAGGFGLTGTDNVISCGSFAGGSTATVNLGYEPQFLLIKAAGASADWNIIDTMRGWSFSAQNTLVPNSSAAESNIGTLATITSTGFTSNAFGSGAGTVIYIAIRRGPMKVPTTGTSVFSPVAYTGTDVDTNITANFAPDLSISQYRLGYPALAADRLRGGVQVLNTTSTGAEVNNGTFINSFGNTGIQVSGTSGSTYSRGFWNGFSNPYIYWLFQRAPGYFDEVCYTGNNTIRTINHNLGVVPEMIIVKTRSGTTGWPVYHQAMGNTRYAFLDLNVAQQGPLSSIWNSTTPTSSVFSLGNNSQTNAADTYVAYLFATCPGVSKVGSYTGTAATQVINCGFTGGARFVMIKRTDSTGDWYVWDSARGIVAGNDPYLLLNSTAAEVTSTDYVDTFAAGFELTATAPAAINASGGTYIFLAIA